MYEAVPKKIEQMNKLKAYIQKHAEEHTNALWEHTKIL